MKDINFTNLYIKDNKGAIRQWSIGSDGNNIVIKHGQLGGSMQYKTEFVPYGKAGRSIDDQIMLRISSRISRQRDKGYSPNIDDANEKPTNQLGLVKPMLAQPLKNVSNINFNHAYYQHKYDGNRMLIAKINGKNIAYTRNGKLVNTINHILSEIDMDDNTILDGEIYCHGESLQTIASWVKREQKNSLMLKYHAYDIVSNLPYIDRLEILRQEVDFGKNSSVVPTIEIKKLSDAQRLFRESRNQGYEGGIIRWGGSGYEDGKRSKSLVKMKEWQDANCFVIDIKESADGWAVLTCLFNGNEFGVSAPGTIEEKTAVLRYKEKYLGRYVRVEYSLLTKDNIPFHPVAVCWED